MYRRSAFGLLILLILSTVQVGIAAPSHSGSSLKDLHLDPKILRDDQSTRNDRIRNFGSNLSTGADILTGPKDKRREEMLKQIEVIKTSMNYFSGASGIIRVTPEGEEIWPAIANRMDRLLKEVEKATNEGLWAEAATNLWRLEEYAYLLERDLWIKSETDNKKRAEIIKERHSKLAEKIVDYFLADVQAQLDNNQSLRKDDKKFLLEILQDNLETAKTSRKKIKDFSESLSDVVPILESITPAEFGIAKDK